MVLEVEGRRPTGESLDASTDDLDGGIDTSTDDLDGGISTSKGDLNGGIDTSTDDLYGRIGTSRDDLDDGIGTSRDDSDGGNGISCGLMGSVQTWDGTGCEFDSWQCRIYIISHVHIEPSITWVPTGFSGYLRLDTKNCVKKISASRDDLDGGIGSSRDDSNGGI